jgi:hypothetical protein
MEEVKKYPKEKQLVTITQYSEKYQLNRHTVYRLMEEGKLTRYLDLDQQPLLDPEEAPTDVRAYEDRQEYPTKSDV